MTTAAPSFHPPWAVICWVDCDAVYIEIPTKAEPYITKFQLNESGLSKALHYLKVIHKVRSGGQRKVNGATKAHSLISRTRKPPEPTNDERREKARAALRKLGIV